MKTYTPERKICGTCDHWCGVRTRDECQFVYVASDAKGACAMSGKVYAHDAVCKEREKAKWQRDRSNRPYLEEVNCWEYMECGFEEGGENAARHGVCPAYPDHGRLCAALERTKCQLTHNAIKGCLPLPRERHCLQCGFYNNVLAHADHPSGHAGSPSSRAAYG